jgi:chromosome partitioning protein
VNLLPKRSKPAAAATPRADPELLLEATMAAAALIAGPEGPSGGDPTALARGLGANPARGVFDLALAAEHFESFVARIRSAPERGRALAFKTACVVAGDSEDAGFELWADSFLGAPAGGDRPLVITVGNEKGGTGKSTIAMHIVVALLKLGYRVASIDLDGRQGTLSRYLENRRGYRAAGNEALAMPLHRRIEPSPADRREAAARHDRARLRQALMEAGDCQVIVMDTPGSDTRLSRLAHANADMVITPLNDTFLDVDVLAQVDRAERRVLGPSLYCEMVAEQNDRRVLSAREPIHWIVMRNRLTHVDSYNKREIAGLLKQLSGRLGFQLVAGFGERVVFHELFLSGLTLLDLPDEPVRDRNYASHLRACEEFRELLLEIGALV